MPGLQDTRRGILQTQINRCTSNVTPSSAFAEYDDTLCHCEERLVRSTRRRKRTKQSILSFGVELTCFASLAMTVSKILALASVPSLRGAKRRSNPFFLYAARWIVWRSLSPAAPCADPSAY